jgi:dCMP deaminase
MRISFSEMAIKFALDASLRSEDPHKQVGCAILNKEGRLLSIGYNGVLSKQEVPTGFWENRDERRKFVIHAETNALSCINRYKHPYALYSTLLPCPSCAINIASHGIKEVIYIEEYSKYEPIVREIFNFYSISLIKYK